MVDAEMLAVSPLMGCQTPRVGVAPTGDEARAVEALQFIEQDLNVGLFPWQRYVIDATCRTQPGTDSWAFRSCLTMVARQNGKTTLCSTRILAGLMLFDERLIIGASQSRDISLETLRRTVEIAEDADLPISKVRRSTGSEELILSVGGRDARFKVVTAAPGSGRGLSADLVVLDEMREYKSEDIWAALDRTRRARPRSQVFSVSTEGDHTSVVLRRLQEMGRRAAAGEDTGSIMYCEWSADPALAPDDRQAWAQANPSLGHLLSVETLADEQRSDPPETFERESLCRPVASSRPWVRLDHWDACADPEARIPDGVPLMLAIDARPDLTHASICAAAGLHDGRTHVEAIAVFPALGPAEARLIELVERWQPAAVAVAGKGAVEALARRVAENTGVEVIAVAPTDQDRASRAFYEAIHTGRLTHPPDPVLGDHVASLQAGAPGLYARTSPVPTDAATAAVLATWAVERAPVPTPAPAWVAW